jgi:glycosyltransferase involved in cell wall biosynthesis
MTEPIDICITTWNRELMTGHCIQAIKQNTKTQYRIILIDNGSNWVAQESYPSMVDIYIKLDRNYGLEYAKHQAMNFVTSKYFVSMDNDILVYNYDPDWLSQLVRLIEKNTEYAAIACKPQILVGTGMYMFQTDKELIDFPHVPGYARIMNTQIVNEVGAWNEFREMRGHEELWIGEALKRRGYKMGWANRIECYHLFGDKDTDPWGYKRGTESGHTPVWPMPSNDYDEIKRKVGITI